MKIFEFLQKDRYEQVVLCQEELSGLKAIIAIHNTTLGPALGGTRMWTYLSEEEATIDALRLARGMTYKAATAGLNLGGGKAVIIANPAMGSREELFRAFGRFVESLGGRYITAEDVGTTVQDMDYVRMETRHVTGYSGGSENPSPATAFGVWYGMKAAALEAFGSESLTGKVVAVQGIGSVGYHLCRHIMEEGGKLVVSDINEQAIHRVTRELQVEVVSPAEIAAVECDIFAPCALGAVVNDDTIHRLNCRIIAGAANNVLHEERHGELLEQRGILYIPDFVINAGGLINVADELQGYKKERAYARIKNIFQNVQQVLAIAKRDGLTTNQAAIRLAEERIARLGKIRSTNLA
jgi:leucine dehydrogenase